MASLHVQDESRERLLKGEDDIQDGGSEQGKKGYFRRAALLSVVDFCVVLALWLAAGYPNESGEGEYVVTSVMNYDFQTSLFDVVVVAFLRALATISFYANVSTLFSPKPSGSRTLLQILALGTPVASIAFLITKTVLVKEMLAAHGAYVVNTSTQTYDISTAMAFDLAALAVSYVVSLLDLGLFFVSRKEFLSSFEYSQLLNQSNDETDVEIPEKQLKHSSISRLTKLALPEKWLLIWGMVNLVIAAISNLAMPLFFGQILGATSKQELKTATINLNIVFVVGSIAAFIRAWLFTLAGQRLVARLRNDLFKAMSIQEIAFFDTTRTGELTNRLASDTQVIQNTVTVNVSMVVRYLIQIIGAIVLLFITSWRLTLIMLSVVPVVAVGAVIYGRYLKKLGSQFQDELAKAASTAEETISNMRTVRSFSKEKKVQAQYEKDIQRSLEIGKKNALVTGGFTGMLSLVAQGAIGLVVYEGAVQVLDGRMGISTLTAFVLYTLTIAMAMAFIASLFGDFMNSVGASERIFELLDKKPNIQVSGGRTLPDISGVLRLNDVVFRYPSRPESLILNHVSMSLEPGHVVALVGPSGGGKSTIVSLIERFYDPVEGTVTLDGVDIRELDPVWYRKQIGFVSQEPVLFACSIKENIAYGVEGATIEQIEEAAKQANAHEFIQTFEQKYDTVVGERGVRLSGGQKQRIAIARALLMNPKILLLDEATSALDAESEHLVQEAIDRAMVNRTVLVIAHRLSTVRSASKVIVISGGGIAESGTHDELVAAGGIYKKLVKRQLQK